MSLVPIDAKARGALLQARDSLADYMEEMAIALPALFACNVPDVTLPALEVKRDIARMKELVDRMIGGTR
ncbi:MAG: hypothetical protein ABFD89_09185 [Bryobacteraceae bacterium]